MKTPSSTTPPKWVTFAIVGFIIGYFIGLWLLIQKGVVPTADAITSRSTPSRSSPSRSFSAPKPAKTPTSTQSTTSTTKTSQKAPTVAKKPLATPDSYYKPNNKSYHKHNNVEYEEVARYNNYNNQSIWWFIWFTDSDHHERRCYDKSYHRITCNKERR